MPRVRATTPAPRPAPQFIIDDTFVQERRTQFGRDTWYDPTAIKVELASIIRRSSFYQRLSAMEVEYAERNLNDWTGEGGYGSGSLNIRCEPSWGVGVDISFAYRAATTSDYTPVEQPNGSSFYIFPVDLEVKLNWSATGRSIPTAQASVALYQEAINLGSMVSAKGEEYAGRVARIRRRIPNPAYIPPEMVEEAARQAAM